jgi:thiol-disulfide isomerase/thioredoxin
LPTNGVSPDRVVRVTMGFMARPALFKEEGFEAASALARSQGRWLLADFTATWCQPCQLMDRKVWADPAVAAWVEEHAIAIQIDIDANSELARSLDVQSVPTVIVFVDGAEKDRSSGLLPPADLLAWFDSLARGETSLDRARAALTDPLRDIKGRLQLARMLLARGLLGEALEHYAWLWCHMHEVEPAYGGVRVSFLASDIQLLCQRLPEAGARFAALRDQAAAAAEGSGPAGEARLDWTVLNGCLGEDERTVEWYDARKDDKASVPVPDEVVDRLLPLLRERERWADAGRLLREPTQELRQLDELSREALAHLPADQEDMRDAMVAGIKHHLRDQATLLVRALRAAGRSADAEAAEREALRLDDSPEMRAALAQAAERGDA